MESALPGIEISPTDGKTVRLRIPLADGTFTPPVFRSKDMLLSDVQTDEFVIQSGRIVKEVYARMRRWQKVDEYLLSRKSAQ